VRALWSGEPRSGERVGRASKDRAIIRVGRACGACEQRSGDHRGRASNWFKSRADTNHCKIFDFCDLGEVECSWNFLKFSGEKSEIQ
jgi:hypothetical protein